MTHKRSKATGNKTVVISTYLGTPGHPLFLKANHSLMSIDTFYVAPCDFRTACEQLLRDETKLDRYLDGSDNE
jgi:hypothetical protein